MTYGEHAVRERRGVVRSWGLVAGVVAASLSALGASACDRSPTDPDATLRPRLLAPAALMPIAQNDPRTGCAAGSPRGRGSRVDFAWGSVPGASAYVIDFRRTDASPVLHRIVSDTTYPYVTCKSYVAYTNLTSWSWIVGSIVTRASGMTDTVWSDRRWHEFQPCVLDDGVTPCSP